MMPILSNAIDDFVEHLMSNLYAFQQLTLHGPIFSYRAEGGRV